MEEDTVELGGEALEAYVQHRLALARVEWEAEQEAKEQARAEALRQAAAHGRNDPAWTSRRDAQLAQRHERVLAARTQTAERGPQ